MILWPGPHTGTRAAFPFDDRTGLRDNHTSPRPSRLPPRRPCPMRPALALGLALSTPLPSIAADPPARADVTRDASALLQRACFECHGPEKQRGGLRLDSRAAALKGGEAGAAVVPGKIGEGELLRRVALPAGAEGAMPPRGERLTAAQLKLLRDWV